MENEEGRKVMNIYRKQNRAECSNDLTIDPDHTTPDQTKQHTRRWKNKNRNECQPKRYKSNTLRNERNKLINKQ
jgi:hypothetical protein